MVTIQEIKRHYFFTDADAELLKSLRPLADSVQERMADEFYDYRLGIPETAAFLKDDLLRKRLRKTHQDWFVNLFSGSYDNLYHHTLRRIGQAHVRIGLNAHFVNAAMNVVRHFLIEVLQENFPDLPERRKYRNAVEKIIDINLDVMSASYQEEELNKVFLSHSLESKLIHAAERFTYGLNLILVVALAGVSLSVIGLFVWDISHIFHGNVEKGILGGKLVDPIRAEKRVQLIATDDIGEWAALALTEPARFLGKALEIAGDELSNPEIAATFAQVLGRPVRFQRLPLFVTRLVLGKEFHQMFKWFNEEGYRADLALLRREYPEVELTSLDAWLRREGWSRKGRSYARHAKTFIAKIPRDD